MGKPTLRPVPRVCPICGKIFAVTTMRETCRRTCKAELEKRRRFRGAPVVTVTSPAVDAPVCRDCNVVLGTKASIALGVCRSCRITAAVRQRLRAARTIAERRTLVKRAAVVKVLSGQRLQEPVETID